MLLSFFANLAFYELRCRMKSKLCFLFILIYSFSTYAQNDVKYNSLDEPIPIDPQVRVGTLPNGLKYYIKYNKKPEKRAELILAVNAGAICEDPEQNGLAHFCEHMAFNGTRNFPKQELVNFLESIGIKFGPELNAFTSWDETVYMLQIPTDSLEQFRKGLIILEDWAHFVTYDVNEIDKERGVVIEEWRLGRGADERVERQHKKIVFTNSKYATHDVIGDTNILRKASYDVIRRFYKDWYRPDLMALIAVGDFDADMVEQLIKERFSKIPEVKNPRQRQFIEIPFHKEILVSIAKDKELSFPRVVIYFKDKSEPQGTFRSYRSLIQDQLFSQMLQYRLNEYLRKENPPFKFFVMGNRSRLGRLNSVFTLFAGARGDGILSCTEALLTEAFRVYQHGFTQSELDRAKNEYLRSIEKAFAERDKTESMAFAMEYVRNFLTKEPIPGIEYELALTKKFLPELKLQDFNNLARKLIKKENAVITISAPDRAEVSVPTETEVLSLFEEISNKDLEPYNDKTPNTPLFSMKIKEGTVISETVIPELQAKEWLLSNGARVVVKPTNYKNDEILFSALSWGGLSLVPDSLYFAALFSLDVIEQSGLGNFNKSQLEKYLADKIVNVSPSITDYLENFNGSSSAKDLHTLLELIHLYFTSPKVDKEAFESVKAQLISNLIDSENQPEKIFSDSVNFYLWNQHFRRKPIDKSDVEKIKLSNVFDVFSNRFSNPSDFVFIFVGSFDPDSIKPLVLKYIASIPTSNNSEKWKDVGMRRIKGKFEKNIYKGVEPKSFVRLSISGPFDFTFRERFLFRAMMNVLQIRMRETLREDKSGVYGVGVWGRPTAVPSPTYEIGVYFGCDPNRVDELTNDALNVLRDVAERIQDQNYLQKVKEIFRRDLEVQTRKNSFWIDLLKNYYIYNDPADYVLQTKKMIDDLSLNDILEMGRKYIKFDNYARFVMYPENIIK